MQLKSLQLSGFKSFAQKTILEFKDPIVAIVGPNGSGKSNVVEAIRFVLGEQSIKSLRGKTGGDLIFKGSKKLSSLSRAGVTIYFDNRDRLFKLTNEGGEEINLNFDTVSISREVFPDGVNKYILNGSEIRLKDIHQLLSSVNIGSSGHHIISQGEADRILNANPRELREMVEDALGLKIYQYKIKESERKLERAEANIKEVAMLRRENAPHLKFLERQVEKFAKAKAMKSELLGLYRIYLKGESIHLAKEKGEISAERKNLEAKLLRLERDMGELPAPLAEKENSLEESVREKERQSSQIRMEKDSLSRKLGRTQGLLELKEKRVQMSGKCPLCGSVMVKREEDERELEGLKETEREVLEAIQHQDDQELKLQAEIASLEVAIEADRDRRRSGDLKKMELTMEKNKILSEINLVKIREDQLAHAENDFQNEIKEGQALVGDEISSYRDFIRPDEPDGQVQEENRKKIERLKIKLEDAGLGNDREVIKEFEEVSKRDQFLEQEMADLERSIQSLETLMADLKEKIELEFQAGVKRINTEFQEFFALMFGGGWASLSVILVNRRRRNTAEEEEEELPEETEEIVAEKGVEINVSLPHKKVKELNALSGGERSLTSIALLFAMSQVNPPPFLVLDETDAALDEANSRKYGDMLEKLSKHSELIVVTHNRETMSRAGVLYGVTIGADGASKLLSVKFEEATQIAK